MVGRLFFFKRKEVALKGEPGAVSCAVSWCSREHMAECTSQVSKEPDGDAPAGAGRVLAGAADSKLGPDAAYWDVRPVDVFFGLSNV